MLHNLNSFAASDVVIKVVDHHWIEMLEGHGGTVLLNLISNYGFNMSIWFQ